MTRENLASVEALDGSTPASQVNATERTILAATNGVVLMAPWNSG
jgi:hypothetical protein